MSQSLFVINTISIHAPASQVWDALTNPQQTKKYMFGCETISDWQKGSSLLWSAFYEGKETVFVKGTIKDIRPGELLSYTTIDANAAIADIPANYLTVTYELKETNGETVLMVTQGNYANVAEGERRYQEAYNNGEGWNPILLEIKKLVEAGL